MAPPAAARHGRRCRVLGAVRRSTRKMVSALAAQTAMTPPMISIGLGQHLAEIELHAHPDQEDAEQQALERRNGGFDLPPVIGFGEHDAGDQRADGRRDADERRSPPHCR